MPSAAKIPPRINNPIIQPQPESEESDDDDVEEDDDIGVVVCFPEAETFDFPSGFPQLRQYLEPSAFHEPQILHFSIITRI